MWTYAHAPGESLPGTVDISATYSPSRRDIIRNLSRLSEIVSFVNALSQTFDSELRRLDAPVFVNSSSFPLHPLSSNAIISKLTLRKSSLRLHQSLP